MSIPKHDGAFLLRLEQPLTKDHATAHADAIADRWSAPHPRWDAKVDSLLLDVFRIPSGFRPAQRGVINATLSGTCR